MNAAIAERMAVTAVRMVSGAVELGFINAALDMRPSARAAATRAAGAQNAARVAHAAYLGAEAARRVFVHAHSRGWPQR